MLCGNHDGHSTIASFNFTRLSHLMDVHRQLKVQSLSPVHPQTGPRTVRHPQLIPASTTNPPPDDEVIARGAANHGILRSVCVWCQVIALLPCSVDELT